MMMSGLVRFVLNARSLDLSLVVDSFFLEHSFIIHKHLLGQECTLT
jgi:hypothetical protein